MPFLFVRAVWALRRDPQFASLAGLTAVAIAGGTVFYALVENLRLVDALYFSVVTLATVGYGDFTPQTDAGKLFTVVYVLIGVGILLSFVTTVSGQVVSDRARRHTRRRPHAAPRTEEGQDRPRRRAA